MTPNHGGEAFAPLGILDTGCDLILFQGYILSKQNGNYDTAPLFDALMRVTDKWRLLAGRIEQGEKTNKYRVRIPLGELRKPAFKFTTAKYDEFIHSPSSSQSYVSPRPDIKYCWDPSTPTQLSKYASLDHPLLSVHVSSLNDATCIGISLPHGVFDGIGGGLVLKAIDAELAGLEWTPPPQPAYNAAETAFAELFKSPDLVEGPREWWTRTFEIFAPATLIYVFKFLALLIFENIFHNAVYRSVFLHKDATDRLVQEVKAQVEAQTNGKKWVSTGDILVAWFLKSLIANSSDTNTRGIFVFSMFSFRELLEPKDSTFSAYPHNCIAPFSIPEMSSSSMRSASLADLSLIHRDRLEEARTLEFIKEAALYIQRLNDKPLILNRRWKSWSEPTLQFTNQTTAGLTDIDFGQGTTVEAFWQWSPPITGDNLLTINKFKGGYIVSGLMRKCRWDAVEKEIERINVGGSFAN